MSSEECFTYAAIQSLSPGTYRALIAKALDDTNNNIPLGSHKPAIFTEIKKAILSFNSQANLPPNRDEVFPIHEKEVLCAEISAIAYENWKNTAHCLATKIFTRVKEKGFNPLTIDSMRHSFEEGLLVLHKAHAPAPMI